MSLWVGTWCHCHTIDSVELELDGSPRLSRPPPLLASPAEGSSFLLPLPPPLPSSPRICTVHGTRSCYPPPGWLAASDQTSGYPGPLAAVAGQQRPPSYSLLPRHDSSVRHGFTLRRLRSTLISCRRLSSAGPFSLVPPNATPLAPPRLRSAPLLRRCTPPVRPLVRASCWNFASRPLAQSLIKILKFSWFIHVHMWMKWMRLKFSPIS